MLHTAQLKELASASGDALVSLYLPTHKSGPETLEGPIRLKNLIACARELAADRGADAGQLKEALAPAEALLRDQEFWQHQRKGLAIFCDGRRPLSFLKLPHTVQELATVDERFNLRPLLPAVTDRDRFHLLAVTRNQVRLWECDRDAARELELGAIPESLEAALGGELDEPTLQHHTASASGTRERPDAMFHGHGINKDDDSVDHARFLRALDEGLHERLRDEPELPLVLAAVEESAVLFRSLTRHPRLVKEAVVGSPAHHDANELHPPALEAATPALEAGHRAELERLRAARGSDKLLEELEPILDAARAGRVELLMLRCEEPLFGTPPDADDGAPQTDLLDLALHAALDTGARVEAAADDELPDDETHAWALLRY